MMNHNDFPKMTEEFDRSVRRALDSLPERESKPVRRFSAKKIVCAGLAAALCIGGTAFAANAQSWFPLLFPNGGDANLEGYVQTADNAKLTDENEHYRLSVESVLFDESAGTGVISLHLANKKQDGVKPFTLAHLIDSYQNKPDITWSTLSSCYAEEGQLDFEVMYGDSGFCGSEFYLDTARSTDNDYYFEGAFAISSDYQKGEPLRLEALDPSGTTVRADGAGTAKTVLAVDLPEFQQMPYLTSADGDVTLSQIGIRIRNADMHCTVDDVDTLSVQLRTDRSTLFWTKTPISTGRCTLTVSIPLRTPTASTPRLRCLRVHLTWIMCSRSPSTARCICSRDKRQDRAKQTANAVCFVC